MLADSALKRLQRGLPAILLGTLFNVLDAVSTGLLVFPSDGNAFAGLQNKSMSMYILSTIFGQVVLTLGGSLFPGALSAMLIEVLPFMRGVASDIRNALGDDNPSVVPTVMVAYALSSFLIGIVFLILGALGAGRVISYFPQTVLTGAIGGIGVSLFILGLELPLPSDESLTLRNAGSLLFSKDHAPLLVASLLPIVFMCYSVRSETLNKLTRGAVQHPYYVPLYFLAIAALFWIIVGALGIERLGGLHTLAANGWIFSTGESLSGGKESLKDALNYWDLFNFPLVQISALGHAVTNFVLLIVIGVLNLPVYVPALALTLDVPYSMNHELIGHGAANILAGAAGTLPNILQLSYSVFFTRAGGSRFEASLVILLTFVLFVVSSYLLQYIPTILASGLVLFLGIELTLEAVWESAKVLIWTEWLVVLATLLSCTFLGFAPGVGVGIAAAVVVYTGWGCWDLRAKTGYIDRRGRAAAEYHYSRLQHTSHEESLIDGSEEKMHPQIRLVHLNGYLFFGVIPSVEAQCDAQGKPNKSVQEEEVKQQYVIVDMHSVNRVETAAAKSIRTKARDSPGLTLVLCGVSESSGTAADLIRSGVELDFNPSSGVMTVAEDGDGIRVFSALETAVLWCKNDIARRENGTLSQSTTSTRESQYQKFIELFASESSQKEATMPTTSIETNSISTQTTTEPISENLEWKICKPQSSVIPRPSVDSNAVHFTFVLSGTLAFSHPTARCFAVFHIRYNRDSLRTLIIGIFRRGLEFAMRRCRSDVTGGQEISSDSDADNIRALDGTRTTFAGHTIYTLPPGHSECITAPSSTTVRGDTMPSTNNWDAASPVNVWPVDCSEAVVSGVGEESCVLVEVRVPCSAIPVSRPSVEELRYLAIDRVLLEIGAEPTKSSSNGG
ncbi:sulfate transporter family-domain-containing protein [Astrocystis sublimbata]|nr:sulfate transporter family-domain-containing protein [Astrocystis sublimbata]